jgi:hypothetical protein
VTVNEQYVFAVSFLNMPLEYSAYSLLAGSGISCLWYVFLGNISVTTLQN